MNPEVERLRYQAAILELLSLSGEPAASENGDPSRLVVDDEVDDSDEPPQVTRSVRVKIHVPEGA